MIIEVKFEKEKIALIQLRQAIRLFNQGDYISSLTLAGAANEILSNFADHNQGYNTIDGDKMFLDAIAEINKKNKPSKGQVIKATNRIKNQVKHHSLGNDIFVKADFEFEAISFIDSAIRNYWIAFDKIPMDRIIKKHVDIHWT